MMGSSRRPRPVWNRRSSGSASRVISGTAVWRGTRSGSRPPVPGRRPMRKPHGDEPKVDRSTRRPRTQHDGQDEREPDRAQGANHPDLVRRRRGHGCSRLGDLRGPRGGPAERARAPAVRSTGAGRRTRARRPVRQARRMDVRRRQTPTRAYPRTASTRRRRGRASDGPADGPATVGASCITRVNILSVGCPVPTVQGRPPVLQSTRRLRLAGPALVWSDLVRSVSRLLSVALAGLALSHPTPIGAARQRACTCRWWTSKACQSKT